MATVNFDVIAQELERPLAYAKETAEKMGYNRDPAMMLKELYTLGLSTSRQTGKGKWLIECLIRHPAARLITINKGLHKSAVAMLNHYRCLNSDNQFVLPGGAGVDLPPDIVEAILKGGPQYLDQVEARIMTTKQLKIAIDNNLGFTDPVDRIYFDGRVQIFNTIRYSKYYTWLAKLSNKPTVTWLID